MVEWDPAVEHAVRSRLGAAEADAFLARLEVLSPDILEPLGLVYGTVTDTGQLAAQLVLDTLAAAAARPEPLRRLDRRREINPAWFQRAGMIGYVCYADRFAGSLAGIREHLDYLVELGVTYLHLMPLLRPREGENDGGYAVADYGAVDPRVGTMADLQALAGDLHERGIALCVDVVLNDTAREHEWARRALAGQPGYREMYLIYPDRTEPDRYERTLPEVFPDLAPGSFTHVPELGWVWTSFHDYQWDLNWANPATFRAMLGVMLDLANRGIDALRLDAVPFLWKRMGTDGQNQPEAHRIVQAFRALTRLAAPGLVLKAEAIVAPEMLAQYLGAHGRFRPECDLAYDNQLMVMLWSSLATRDVRLAEAGAGPAPGPAPAPASWVTYVRCHDDIGWAVSDADACAARLDGFAHRRFLADYYAGRFPGSFARGALFQENPATGDARTSGMAASLCGIGAALEAEDAAGLTAAIRRLESVYAAAFSFGGSSRPSTWATSLPYAAISLGCSTRRTRTTTCGRTGRGRHWLLPRAATTRPRSRAVFAATPRAGPGPPLRRWRCARRQHPGPAHRDRSALGLPAGPSRSAPFLALTNFSDVTQSVDAGIIARAWPHAPAHVHSTACAADPHRRADRAALVGLPLARPAPKALARLRPGRA